MIAWPESRLDIQVLAPLLGATTADALAPDRVSSQSASMTSLPHSDEAIFDIRKIEDYCLNPSHPRGRHKARVFREALDLRRGDAAWLRDALLEAARSSDASQVAVDAWGTHWRIDTTVRRQGRSAVVRTIWIVRTGERAPRFVTCWVL